MGSLKGAPRYPKIPSGSAPALAPNNPDENAHRTLLREPSSHVYVTYLSTHYGTRQVEKQLRPRFSRLYRVIACITTLFQVARRLRRGQSFDIFSGFIYKKNNLNKDFNNSCVLHYLHVKSINILTYLR